MRDVKTVNKIIFFVSAMKALDRGHGGVAKLVDELSEWLVHEGFDVEIVAGFGVPLRADASYTLTVLNPNKSHCSDSSLYRRSIYWASYIIGLSLWALHNFKVLRASQIISCNPGASTFLSILVPRLLIWENVAFFSRRNRVDRLRLKLAFSCNASLIVPAFEEIGEIHRVLGGSGKRLPITHINNWISEDSLNTDVEVSSEEVTGDVHSQAVSEDYNSAEQLPFRFIAAGQLDQRKGFHVLVQAADAIRRKSKFSDSFRIEIYGEGVGQTMLQQQIDECNLRDIISINGFSDELSCCLKQNHFFCLPSLYEGFPLVLISAQALGLPAVVTNCCWGISDVIQSGKNGYICRVEDSAAFAAGMVKLMRNSDYFMSEGRRLSVQYSEPYRASVVFPKWRQLLRKMHE